MTLIGIFWKVLLNYEPQHKCISTPRQGIPPVLVTHLLKLAHQGSAYRRLARWARTVRLGTRLQHREEL